MALNFLLKRSGTASKRPTAASMALGELDLNYDASTGGVYYKDSVGNVVKVGPTQVSATAPNTSPAGSSGNSTGEFWYDTANNVLKVYDGTSWVNAVSTSAFLPLAGGTMTGAITFAAGQTLPVDSIQDATTSQKGVVQLTDSTSSTSTTTAATPNSVKTAYDLAAAALPASGGTLTGPITFDGSQTFPASGLPAASTTQPGIVQLNDTVSSTSVTEALTANQGKLLQDQINALSVSSNITLAGSIDASTGLMASVTDAGASKGFVIGDPLPSPSSTNKNYFVIVTVAGTMTPTGGTSQICHQGDWWLSDGTAWVFLDVGFNATAATTTTPGVVQLATDAEVQAGVNTDHAVTPSGLQSKVSDSTSTSSSTTLASSTAVKSAYDAGIQGQTDAAAALAAANAAGTDVGNLTSLTTTDKSSAVAAINEVNAAAGAAQADATQALSDAAAAQSTADAAVPDASYTALGDVLAGTGAGTYLALPVGTDGQVLTACSTCGTGLTWATPSAGTSTWTTYNQLITFNPGDANQSLISWPAERGSSSGNLSSGNVSAMVYITASSGADGAIPESWAQIMISSVSGVGLSNIIASDVTNGQFVVWGVQYPAFTDTTIGYAPNASFAEPTTYLFNITMTIFGGFGYTPTIYGTPASGSGSSSSSSA